MYKITWIIFMYFHNLLCIYITYMHANRIHFRLNNELPKHQSSFLNAHIIEF